ncbi:hypothetical protein D3C72_1923520 [compost metagenome]
MVEGPFAANAAYLRMLQAATGRPVLADSHNVTGTSLGAASLVDGRHVRTGVQAFAGPVPGNFVRYAENWRSLTKTHVRQGRDGQQR